MTSVVASPALLHASNNSNNYPGSPKSGILLNPLPQGRSPLRQSLPLYPSESSAYRHSAPNTPFMQIHGNSVPLPRTDSRSSSNSGGPSPGGTQGGGGHSRANSMRIRFAPLPDPRKLEEQEYMDSPLATNNLALSATDETSMGSPTTPGSQYSHTSANSNGSMATPGGSALFPSYTASDDGRDGTETASDQGTFSSPVQKSRSWTKRIFKPLLKSTSMASSSSAGNNGHQSDDGLWRTNSRDSLQSATSNEGLGLSRRMTTDAASHPSSSGNGVSSGGAPLTRIQSAGVGPSRSRKNQKMLNGRVYGAKSAAAAFQNIKDVEPAFVEWGNGGAGSVNSHGGAVSAKYAGVQSANRVSIGAISGGDGSQPGGDDYDDGSGVAWLRRRKQERAEKEAKEHAEKVKAERAAKSTPAAISTSAHDAEKASPSITGPAAGPPSSSLSTPPVSERDDAQAQARALPERKSSQTIETVSPRQGPGSGTPTIISPSGTTGMLAMGTLATTTTPGVSGTHTPAVAAVGEEHHIVKAVKIPVLPHAHGHGHTHVHGHGHTHGGLEEPTAMDNPVDTSEMALTAGTDVAPPPPSSKSSSDSDSEEEDDDDDDEREEDESETDEEDNAENEQRKTSVCAGVEKVSRHKELEAQ